MHIDKPWPCFFNKVLFLFFTGQGECHDMTKSFGPGGCPANTYILTPVAALQASIDAAITKVRN